MESYIITNVIIIAIDAKAATMSKMIAVIGKRNNVQKKLCFSNTSFFVKYKITGIDPMIFNDRMMSKLVWVNMKFSISMSCARNNMVSPQG
jgi:ferric iron reductase protein FhuF